MTIIYGTLGTDGDEILIGSDASENFDSGLGNDTVYGGGGDDGIPANHSGNKVFFGQGGNDTISGQVDDDFHYAAAYEGPLSHYSIQQFGIAANITDTTGADGVDRVFHLDELQFADTTLFWVGNRWSTIQRVTDGDDRISLGVGENYIGGKAGNDYIRGNNGVDAIQGGSGNDKLDGGAGDDFLSGGLGNDSLYGGEGKDQLHGFYGNDVVHGEAGNDTVYGGGEGIVYLFGDQGNDTMIGASEGAGRVKIMGGEGDDTMMGSGSAYLQGDAGKDSFYFSTETSGIVKVLDFTQGEDKLLFGTIEFDSLEDVTSHASENANGDTVIDYGSVNAGSRIIISGIAPGELTESDFTFQ